MKKKTNINLSFASLVEFCQPLELYGFHVTARRDTLISNVLLSNEDVSSNYKEAMAGPQAATWTEMIDYEIQSMIDNQVQNMVDRTPIIGCNWIFIMKINMDVNKHAIEARLVVRSYTQTQGIEHEKTSFQ